MSRTLEQLRAKHALDEIMFVAEKGDDKEALAFKKKYATHVRRTPTRILNNGLGQALAFLLADAEGNDKSPSGLFYKNIFENWLVGKKTPTKPQIIYEVVDGDEKNLISELMKGDRHSYIRAQVEALALLNWVKKFTDAYLPKDTGGE